MARNKITDLEYSRRLYDNVLGWYMFADSKAQVILGIDGVFIAFVSSTIFMKQEDLQSVVGSFALVSWIFLALMFLSIIGSIGTSIYCLWSRIYSESELRDIMSEAIEEASSETESSELYPPSITCFFQFIEYMDIKMFGKTLEAVDTQFEIEALTSQIHILSGNVRKKHFAVNVGFILAAIALILLFATAISYSLTVL